MTNLDTVIDEYLKDLAKQRGVVGVALTGSTGRGDNDEYSDIDVVLFIDSINNTELVEGKINHKGSLFDVRVNNIVDLRNIEWLEDMYFAYLNSRLIYDQNNQISRLIEEKRMFWRVVCKSQSILAVVNLSVIFDFGGWRGLKDKGHYHKAVSRGDIVSAHWILNNGFELVLRTVYLLAYNPPPDQKNRIKLLGRFSILSNASYLDLVNGALLVKKFDAEETARRYEILMKLIILIKQNVDSSSELWPEDFYKFYIEHRA